MIFIVSEDLHAAESFAGIFRFMGALAYSVTPKEAESELLSIYRAVLFLEPKEWGSELADQIKEQMPTVPIFAVSDRVVDEKYQKVYPPVEYSSATAADILEQLPKRWDTARKYGRIPFTKTEIMILGYLGITAPVPQTGQDILKYSFKRSRCPEISGIRTHISVINRKYREATGKNIILSTEDGYVLRDE